MNYDGGSAYPHKTDEGFPGVYASDGEGVPVFLITESFFNQQGALAPDAVVVEGMTFGRHPAGDTADTIRYRQDQADTSEPGPVIRDQFIGGGGNRSPLVGGEE